MTVHILPKKKERERKREDGEEGRWRAKARGVDVKSVCKSQHSTTCLQPYLYSAQPPTCGVLWTVCVCVWEANRRMEERMKEIERERCGDGV